jgi:hypothetical protein
MPPPTPPDPSASWLGPWSRPADHPAQIALALGCLLIVSAIIPGGTRRLLSALDFSGVGDRVRTQRFLAVTGLAAAFLSIAYVDAYLHGGPRGLDAPIYWLQGRVLSHGSFSWTVPSPLASYRAKGLIAALPDRLSGIFPPGYPLLLAAGFLVGAPMLVGPVIAGGLVVCTWFLTRELAVHAGGKTSVRPEQAAGLAVGLSVVCAALRRETADTLPHGAAALAIALALTSALRGRRMREPRLFAIAGLALGWLVSVRPVAALPVGGVAIALMLRSARNREALGWSIAGALPGIALLLGANHAAIGQALASPASTYGASVAAIAVPLTTATQDAATALREVRVHMMDIANFEPLALALFLGLSSGRRTVASSCAALVVAGQLAAYAWAVHARLMPAAGSLSEILPIEHALIGYGVAAAFSRSFERVATATIGLTLGGFAVHAAAAHAALGSSDLGRPHFEADVLQEAGVTRGLLFLDDDDGFELAAIPGLEASRGVQAVRLRGDDHDRIAYETAEANGHSAAHRYVVTAAGASTPSWSPASPGAPFWRFEAESDWPPMMVSGGSASRLQLTTSCVSGSAVLALSPAGQRDARLTMELPVPAAPIAGPKRNWTVTPRIYQVGQTAEGSLDLMVGSPSGSPVAHWSWRDDAGASTCRDLAPAGVELGRAPVKAWLILTARGGQVALDRTLLR